MVALSHRCRDETGARMGHLIPVEGKGGPAALIGTGRASERLLNGSASLRRPKFVALGFQGTASKLDGMSRTLGGVERIALWMAYSRACAYCGELIPLRDLEIDHIIPVSLEEHPEELNRLKGELGLPSEFTLNSLNNLLPTHGRCNLRKTDQIFESSRIRYFLEVAEGKLEAIRRLIPSLELQASKERLLGAVQSELESGNLEFSDLVGAASKAKGFPLYTRIEFESGKWDGTTDSKQIDSLLDTPVAIGAIPKPDGVRFISANGGSMAIRTCREFRAAISAKFYPSDNTQLKMSLPLMRASALLEAASRARLAAISYIKSPHVGVADLYLLPAYLLPRVGDEQKQDGESLSSSSLQSFLSAKKISILSVSSDQLSVVIGDIGMLLQELLRADLDGDGIEEILVQRTIYATQGTFRAYEIGLLRRPEPDVGLTFGDWAQNGDWARAQREIHIARIMR